MGQLKILFGVFQIVSTFLGTFSVEWPAAFEDFIDSIIYLESRIITLSFSFNPVNRLTGRFVFKVVLLFFRLNRLLK